MTSGQIVGFLVVLALLLVGAYLAVEIHHAPRSCDDCEGLRDCTNCGPIARRAR